MFASFSALEWHLIIYCIKDLDWKLEQFKAIHLKEWCIDVVICMKSINHISYEYKIYNRIYYVVNLSYYFYTNTTVIYSYPLILHFSHNICINYTLFQIFKTGSLFMGIISIFFLPCLLQRYRFIVQFIQKTFMRSPITKNEYLVFSLHSFRLFLISSILNGLSLYVFSLLKAPKWVISNMEKLIRDFFWSESDYNPG